MSMKVQEPSSNGDTLGLPRTTTGPVLGASVEPGQVTERAVVPLVLPLATAGLAVGVGFKKGGGGG